MENVKTKTPMWYWITASFFLLWNVMGVLSFFGHTFISEDYLAKLSVQEQALYGSYPLCTIVVFGIAVFSGFLGSVGLILKKKWSKSAFILSLCAIIPQMIHNVFFTKSMEVYGPGEATTMPIMVVTFGIFLVWFSDRLIRKEWLK